MATMLATNTVRNVSFVAIAQIIAVGLNLITLMILARLLSTEEMGIVGTGLIFLNLLFLIHDFGVHSAIVQRDDRIKESIATGISLRWISSILMTAVVLASAPLIVILFGDDRVPAVIAVLCVNLFILIFSFSPSISMTRRLMFKELSIVSVAQYLTLAIVTITLAFAGLSYWSIVIGSAFGNLTLVALMNYLQYSSHRPRLDIGIARELLVFGKHLLWTALMVFVIYNIDQIVIANTLGVATLGVYFVAVRFGRSVGEQMAITLNRVLFPTMSRIKHDLQKLRESCSRSMRMIAIVAAPFSMGMAALSPLVVGVALGPGWEDAVMPLTILAFNGLLCSFMPPMNSLLTSIGRPRYLSIQSTGQAFAMLVGVYPVSILYGINGVSLYATLVSLAAFLYFQYIVSNVLDVPVVSLLRLTLPPVSSGFVMFLIVFILANNVSPTLVSLISLALLGGAIYAVLLHVTSGGRDIRSAIEILKVVLLKDARP